MFACTLKVQEWTFILFCYFIYMLLQNCEYYLYLICNYSKISRIFIKIQVLRISPFGQWGQHQWILDFSQKVGKILLDMTTYSAMICQQNNIFKNSSSKTLIEEASWVFMERYCDYSQKKLGMWCTTRHTLNIRRSGRFKTVEIVDQHSTNRFEW